MNKIATDIRPATQITTHICLHDFLYHYNRANLETRFLKRQLALTPNTVPIFLSMFVLLTLSANMYASIFSDTFQLLHLSCLAKNGTSWESF